MNQSGSALFNVYFLSSEQLEMFGKYVDADFFYFSVFVVHNSYFLGYSGTD